MLVLWYGVNNDWRAPINEIPKNSLLHGDPGKMPYLPDRDAPSSRGRCGVKL
jgi:hypothetical protein